MDTESSVTSDIIIALFRLSLQCFVFTNLCIASSDTSGFDSIIGIKNPGNNAKPNDNLKLYH
jgi:hypothetical protein